MKNIILIYTYTIRLLTYAVNNKTYLLIVIHYSYIIFIFFKEIDIILSLFYATMHSGTTTKKDQNFKKIQNKSNTNKIALLCTVTLGKIKALLIF